MLKIAPLYITVAAAFAISATVADVQAQTPADHVTSAVELDGVPSMAFDTVESDHFRLLIDTEAARPDMGATVGLLESTHNAFFAAFPASRFDLGPLREPVTWVCFQASDQFSRYARLADRRDMSHLRGYYSARTNRVALLMDDLSIASTARSSRMTSNATEDHAAADTLAPRRIDRRISHEAVHQLAFNSGLYHRGVMYPLWAGEGLATNFERITVDPIGPAHDNPDRRSRLVEAARAGRLVPLSQFAVLVRLPRDPGDAADRYAQAWGLFHFLYRRHPAQLAKYLTAAAHTPPGWRDPQSLADAFTDAFGPIAPLSAEFLAWVDQLPRD